MLHIYNDLTRTKEEFKPLNPPRVTFYNCGPTVYDYFHIGNARNFVVVDLIRRYLRYRGYEVQFVQNITDIDDKIINRANEEGTSTTAIVDKYSLAYFKHLEALGVEPANLSPKATEHIPEIVGFIQRLIDEGCAYEAEGDVFFRVDTFPEYGKLSHKKIEDLIAGERVEVDPKKEDPKDFDLWKAAKPGEPSWESPWGPGRPGWHIECSVMATTHLGDTIDIHAGGSDLTFPHHENEIAQTEAATGKPFVRYWVHNAFLNISGEKMSKSLGNYVTMDQVLEHHDPMVVRYFFLSAHYRRPMDYSPDSLAESNKALARLTGGLETIGKVLDLIARKGDTEPKAMSKEDRETFVSIRERFCKYMDDDFNTPRALSVLFDAVKDLHDKRRRFEDVKKGAPLRHYARWTIKLIHELAGVLGLGLESKTDPLGGLSAEPMLALLAAVRADAAAAGTDDLVDALERRMAEAGWTFDARPDPPAWMAGDESMEGAAAVGELIETAIDARNVARTAKSFDVADRIRSALSEMGIALEDYRAGTIWKTE